MKWPDEINLGLQLIRIRYLNYTDFNRCVETASDLDDHTVSFADYEAQEICIAVENHPENRRQDWELISNLIHELIHWMADQNSSSDLTEEAAVDFYAREITKLLIGCELINV